MVVLKFRTNSDAKDLLKKLKKMHKFTKELIECVEEKYDEEYEEDDEEDYRYEDEEMVPRNRTMYRARYRRMK